MDEEAEDDFEAGIASSKFFKSPEESHHEGGVGQADDAFFDSDMLDMQL